MTKEFWTITIAREAPEPDAKVVVEPQIGFQEPEFDHLLRMFIEAMFRQHHAVVEGFVQTSPGVDATKSKIQAVLEAAGVPQATIDNVIQMAEEGTRGQLVMYKDSPPRNPSRADWPQA